MTEFSEETKAAVWAAVHEIPAVDVRCFAKPPQGAAAGVIDSLLTSPILLDEFFRRRAMARRDAEADAAAHEAYVRSLNPDELADIVWRQLFVEHPPLSEAARVVLTTLGLFGLDVGCGDLRLLRQQYNELPAADRMEKTLSLANLELVLFPTETLLAEAKDKTPAAASPSFRPVLSLDSLLGDWKESARRLRVLGFGVKGKVDEFAPMELRRYLGGEIARIAPVAFSLDWPSGHHPGDDGVGRLVREAVLPLCREMSLPFFVAAGEREPAAGGFDNAIDIAALAPLWEDAPDVRFLLFPTREEQLFPACRQASRSRNLLLCGPDRFLSYPLFLENFIRQRLETSGSAFHACHSGADVLEGLVGRWAHMRWTLGTALINRYAEIARTGWRLDEADIRRDVAAMLGGNAKAFLGL